MECSPATRTCSRCGDAPTRSPGQAWCRACHAAYQRANRPAWKDLTVEQRRRGNARSYANVYLRLGKIERTPCTDCGTMRGLQMHHADYAKPLAVTFLCKRCHRKRHASFMA